MAWQPPFSETGEPDFPGACKCDPAVSTSQSGKCGFSFGKRLAQTSCRAELTSATPRRFCAKPSPCHHRLPPLSSVRPNLSLGQISRRCWARPDAMAGCAIVSASVSLHEIGPGPATAPGPQPCGTRPAARSMGPSPAAAWSPSWVMTLSAGAPSPRESPRPACSKAGCPGRAGPRTRPMREFGPLPA